MKNRKLATYVATKYLPSLTVDYILLSVCRYRFSAIAVDPQVKTVNGDRYDVMFVGTGQSLLHRTRIE